MGRINLLAQGASYLESLGTTWSACVRVCVCLERKRKNTTTGVGLPFRGERSSWSYLPQLILFQLIGKGDERKAIRFEVVVTEGILLVWKARRAVLYG